VRYYRGGAGGFFDGIHVFILVGLGWVGLLVQLMQDNRKHDASGYHSGANQGEIQGALIYWQGQDVVNDIHVV
jgi:hypothetical protein